MHTWPCNVIKWIVIHIIFKSNILSLYPRQIIHPSVLLQLEHNNKRSNNNRASFIIKVQVSNFDHVLSVIHLIIIGACTRKSRREDRNIERQSWKCNKETRERNLLCVHSTRRWSLKHFTPFRSSVVKLNRKTILLKHTQRQSLLLNTWLILHTTHDMSSVYMHIDVIIWMTLIK